MKNEEPVRPSLLKKRPMGEPGMRDLRSGLSFYVQSVRRDKRPVVIHMNHQPIAALVAVDGNGHLDIPDEHLPLRSELPREHRR